MRVYYTYFDLLISCGMMRQAISEGQRLLELCESDNLGVRYQMMHLYVFLEDEMHALALHKQFDSYEETQMLLPLAVLYYKLNKFDKAEDYIRRLTKVNKDTKKFLRAAAHDKLDDYIDELNPFGYQPFTMEELLNELIQFSYLFDSVPYFFAWASKVLAAKSGTNKDIKVADMADNINMRKQSDWRTKASGSRRKQMERCVLCWCLSNVPKDTPIAKRKYYVQGQGQLCENAAMSCSSRAFSPAGTI